MNAYTHMLPLRSGNIVHWLASYGFVPHVHVMYWLFTNLYNASPMSLLCTGAPMPTHQLSEFRAISNSPISTINQVSTVAAAAGKNRRGNRRSADLLMDTKAVSCWPWRYSLIGFNAQT